MNYTRVQVKSEDNCRFLARPVNRRIPYFEKSIFEYQPEGNLGWIKI